MTGIGDGVFSPTASTSVRRSGQSRTSSSARNPTRENAGQYQHQYHSLRKQASVASTRSAWKLKYQDFTLPVTEGECDARSEAGNYSGDFQQLVTKANEWLRQNPAVRVRTGETVTWMTSDPKERNNSERMAISRRMSDGAITFHRRGLRLWLVPQHSAKTQETLCCEDFLPESNDRISDLVEKINNRIERRQLRGRIVSVQTVDAPLRRGKTANNSTGWTDDADTDSRYAFFLRLFYLTDHNTVQESVKSQKLVGVRDFVPEETGEGYEAFEALIDGANTWMKTQVDLMAIANMQSVIVQKQGSSGTGSCVYVIPGVHSTESTEFLRILRVAFLRRKSFSTSSSADFLSTVPPISYETVTPQLLSTAATEKGQTERLETMKETFAKVVSLLRNTNAEIVCVETVVNPTAHLYSDEDDDDDGQMDRSEDDVIRFLLTVRLYLSCQSRNGSRRSTGVTTSHVTGVEEDAGGGRREVNKGRRSSPLFLGSVVTRQFKYRWLVLAVSAFTCMAIIVVVSVVYSNK